MTGSAIDLQSLLHGGEVGLMLRSSCEEVRLRLRSRSLQRRLCRGNFGLMRRFRRSEIGRTLCHCFRYRGGLLYPHHFLGLRQSACSSFFALLLNPSNILLLHTQAKLLLVHGLGRSLLVLQSFAELALQVPLLALCFRFGPHEVRTQLQCSSRSLIFRSSEYRQGTLVLLKLMRLGFAVHLGQRIESSAYQRSVGPPNCPRCSHGWQDGSIHNGAKAERGAPAIAFGKLSLLFTQHLRQVLYLGIGALLPARNRMHRTTRFLAH